MRQIRGYFLACYSAEVLFVVYKIQPKMSCIEYVSWIHTRCVTIRRGASRASLCVKTNAVIMRHDAFS